MISEAEKRAKAKYRQKTKQVSLVFYPTEKDLLEWLNQQDNKAGYIKNLIRQDMEAHQSN